MTGPAVTPETRADLHRRLDALLDLAAAYDPNRGNGPPSAEGLHAAAQAFLAGTNEILDTGQALVAHLAGLAEEGHDPLRPPAEAEPDRWRVPPADAASPEGARLHALTVLRLLPSAFGCQSAAALCRDLTVMDMGGEGRALVPRAETPGARTVEREIVEHAALRALYVGARVHLLRGPRDRPAGRGKPPSPFSLIETWIRETAFAGRPDARKAAERRLRTLRRARVVGAGSPLGRDGALDKGEARRLDNVARSLVGDRDAGDLSPDEHDLAALATRVFDVFGIDPAEPTPERLREMAGVIASGITPLFHRGQKAG